MKKKNRRLIYIFIVAAFSLQCLQAQKITVELHIDSSFIFIGQQTRLLFEITQKNQHDHVIFPFFSKQIQENIEILEDLKIDSLFSPDNLLVVRHEYTITAFEDSLYYIEPLPFILENDTFWSKPLSLKVIQPFYLDTISNAITDIKPVYSPKFYWVDLIKYTFISLLIILILAVVFWIIKSRLQKSNQIKTLQILKKKGKRSYYNTTIERLKDLEEDKAWRRGEIKETFTNLSSILKTYCSQRFLFDASKLTSDEIREKLNFLKKSEKELYNKISTIFSTADLVKFSNFKPSEIEIEENIKEAFAFVKQLKEKENHKETE